MWDLYSKDKRHKGNEDKRNKHIFFSCIFEENSKKKKKINKSLFNLNRQSIILKLTAVWCIFVHNVGQCVWIKDTFKSFCIVPGED